MRIGAEVYLWGNKIGTVVQNDMTSVPQFMYDSRILMRRHSTAFRECWPILCQINLV